METGGCRAGRPWGDPRSASRRRRVAVEPRGQPDRVDEPAAPLGATAGRRRLDAGDPFQALGIGGGDGGPAPQQGVELLDLGDPESGWGEVAEPSKTEPRRCWKGDFPLDLERQTAPAQRLDDAAAADPILVLKILTGFMWPRAPMPPLAAWSGPDAGLLRIVMRKADDFGRDALLMTVELTDLDLGADLGLGKVEPGQRDILLQIGERVELVTTPIWARPWQTGSP